MDGSGLKMRFHVICGMRGMCIVLQAEDGIRDLTVTGVQTCALPISKLAWPDPLIFIYPRWEIHSSQWIAYLPLLAATVGLVPLWLVPGKAGRAVFFAAAY